MIHIFYVFTCASQFAQLQFLRHVCLPKMCMLIAGLDTFVPFPYFSGSLFTSEYHRTLVHTRICDKYAHACMWWQMRALQSLYCQSFDVKWKSYETRICTHSSATYVCMFVWGGNFVSLWGSMNIFYRAGTKKHVREAKSYLNAYLCVWHADMIVLNVEFYNLDVLATKVHLNLYICTK